MKHQQDSQLKSFRIAVGLLAAVTGILAGSAMVLAAPPPGYIDASAYGGGYNATDATAALQAAINTGQNVWVPNMGTPWNITPISLTKSNQTIQFQSGTVVAAKAGAFLGTNDSLFTAGDISNVKMIGYGATLQMRKNDYTQGPYPLSEFRMGVRLFHVSNFEISGLTIKDTGGDGIFIDGYGGPTGFYSQDVLIKDVRLDNNHRQGISVISAKNLTIDNAVILNTNGTAPQAGIDFEPDYPDQVLQNITVKNSIINSNAYAGILFYLGTEPDPSTVGVSIENIRIMGNGFDGIRLENSLPNVTIKNSLFVNNTRYGVEGTFSSQKPDNLVLNSAFWGNSIGAYNSRISLSNGLTNVQPLFYSTDPNSPYYMYLDPAVSSLIATGADDGGYMGARPVYVVPEPSALMVVAAGGLLLNRPKRRVL